MRKPPAAANTFLPRVAALAVDLPAFGGGIRHGLQARRRYPTRRRARCPIELIRDAATLRSAETYMRHFIGGKIKPDEVGHFEGGAPAVIIFQATKAQKEREVIRVQLPEFAWRITRRAEYPS